MPMRRLAIIACTLLLSGCLHDRAARAEAAFCSSIDDPGTGLPLTVKLTDVPDESGFPLSYTPWSIVAVAPGAGDDALTDAAAIASGETGADGVLQLDGVQRHALAQARCARQALWLRYPGQRQALDLQFQTPRGEHCGPTTAQTLCVGYSP